MTTENLKTRIEKTFILSVYENGEHVTSGWANGRRLSVSSSLSPLENMLRAFELRPLGTQIKVTMEEID